MNTEDLSDDLKLECDLQDLKVRKTGEGRKELNQHLVKLDVDVPMNETDELLPEYNFDYSKAKPNRFAKLTHK